MTETKASSKSGTSWLLTLATLAGGIAAIATVFGFVLHGCGHVADSTYLRQWGIDDGLFVRSGDWKVVNGYYAVVLQGFGILKAFPWLAMVGIAALLAFALFVVRLPTPKRSDLAATLERIPPLVKLAGKSLHQSVLAVYFAGCAFLAVLFIAIVPGLIGERAGKELAKQDQEAWRALPAQQWQELWQDDKRVARGKVIAASETRIAILDRDLDQVRVLAGADMEVRASRPSPTLPAPAKAPAQ